MFSKHTLSINVLLNKTRRTVSAGYRARGAQENYDNWSSFWPQSPWNPRWPSENQTPSTCWILSKMMLLNQASPRRWCVSSLKLIGQIVWDKMSRNLSWQCLLLCMMMMEWWDINDLIPSIMTISITKTVHYFRGSLYFCQPVSSTVKPVTTVPLMRDWLVIGDCLLVAVVLFDIVQYIYNERPPLLKDHFLGGIQDSLSLRFTVLHIHEQIKNIIFS